MTSLPLRITPSIKAVSRRPSLATAVARELQETIARQKLAAGTRLPCERDLAMQLAVSRPVVREAIRLLEGLGIVRVEHGKGLFLLDRQSLPLSDLSQLDSVFRLKLLRQATGVRRLIDVEAGRCAAREATAQDLARIEAYLAQAETEPLLSKRRFALDLTFEKLIGEAAHNDYLVAAQRVAHQMFEAAWQSSGVIPRPAELRNRQHRAIFAAIRAGDEQRVAALLDEHFSTAVSPAAQRRGRRR